MRKRLLGFLIALALSTATAYAGTISFTANEQPDLIKFRLEFSKYNFSTDLSKTATLCKAEMLAKATEYINSHNLDASSIDPDQIMVSMRRNELTGVNYCSAVCFTVPSGLNFKSKTGAPAIPSTSRVDDIQGSYDKLEQNIKGQAATPTSKTERLAAYSDSIDALIDSTLRRITDPAMKLELKGRFLKEKAQRMERFSAWLDEQETNRTEESVKQLGDDLAMALNNGSLSVAEVRKRITDFDTSHALTYTEVYGQNAPEMLRRDKATAVQNYLSDTAIKYPKLIKARINQFDDIIPATFKVYLLSRPL